MRYHFTPARTVIKKKKKTTAGFDENVEKLAPSYIAAGTVEW